VTGGLLVPRVDGRRQGLDQREPEPLLRVHELRVLDGNGRRRRERAEGDLVLDRELAGGLVDRLEDADDRAVVAGHREGEEIARAEAGAFVVLGVEPRIGVRVGDVDGLAGLRDGPGNADADREADLTDALTGRDARPELLPVLVDDVDRGALRADHRHRRLGDEAQQRVEVGDGHEPPRDVEQGVEISPASACAALGLPPLAGQLVALSLLLLRAPLGGAPVKREPAHDGSSKGICTSTGPTLSAIRSRSI
jgi:hypothetical protein